MEAKLKHLEFIQGIVNRLGADSFRLKGWTMVLVFAIFALLARTGCIESANFAVALVVAVWGLDGYFLWQERLFRALYDHVRQLKDSEIDFSMNISPFRKTRTLLGATLSRTLIVFYGILAAFALVVTVRSCTDLGGYQEMARRVFFSFKYENDVSRAMVVRNSWVTQGKEASGFVDAADFEEVEKGGDTAIKRWIDDQLDGTSVTVVLVGSDTCASKYVKYEIDQSIAKGNGLLGIDISKIKDLSGNTSTRCGKRPEGYTFYLWNNDDGYNKMGDWIEEAAKDAGR